MKKLKIFSIIILVLIVIRLIIPAFALAVLNHLLDQKMGTYYGHVQDLDLSLYRGAYQLQDLEIKKRDSKNAPLLFIKEIDLSMAWRGLLKKNITADVTLIEAKVEIADSEDKAKKQTGLEEPTENWRAVFDTLVPISIETLKVHQSTLSFTNRDLKEPLAVVVKKVELQVHNLRSHPQGELSPFYLKAEIQNHAKIDVIGKLNILANPPEGEVDFKIEKFKMASINQMLLLYIPVDFTKGELSVFAEAAFSGGNTHGYAKLFLNDVDIIAPKQKYIGIKHFFVEIGTAFGNWLLKNNKTKKVALRLPFNYQNGKLDLNSSDAFWSAIKNNSEAMKPGIENSVSLKK